jgi:hypothetical protein
MYTNKATETTVVGYFSELVIGKKGYIVKHSDTITSFVCKTAFTIDCYKAIL